MDFTTSNVTSTATPLNIVSGAALSRLLRGKSPRERARVVAQLVKPNVAVVGLLAEQAARLAEVSSAEVCTALGHDGNRGPQKKTLDFLVRRYGPDTLMRVLDRATALQRVAAE